MKLKYDLEKKINSLTSTQFDFLCSVGIHLLMDEIIVIIQEFDLVQKPDPLHSSWWLNEDDGEITFYKNVKCDSSSIFKPSVEITLSKGIYDDWICFSIDGIILEESQIKEGFFKDKIDWTNPKERWIDYFPLNNNRSGSKNYSHSHFGKKYNLRSEGNRRMGNTELMNLDPNRFRISNTKEEIKVVESMIQIIYNYLHNIESKIQEEKNRKIKVKSKVKNLVSEKYDKNSDGKLDIIQGDNLLIDVLEKNESVIVKFDHTIIQKIIRLNRYLEQKRKNLGEIFEILKKIDSDEKLKSFLIIFNQSIENYQSLLLHSLNMVVSINKKEMIVYYEIYESFDQMGVFNSNWENEISGKLSSIDFKLSNVIRSIMNVMNSIESMERSISSSIDNLTYVTKSSYQSLQTSLTSELTSIRNGVGLNNLLTGINTIQLHQIKKQTKGLNE